MKQQVIKLPKRFFHTLLVLLSTCGMAGSSYAQQNIGVGTASPHPSAILHLADSLDKGFAIPCTDTNAVIALVNSIVPSPGIANGLLVFQKSDQVFYYYDGNQSRFVPLSGITGPQGPQGPVGDEGPRGPRGGFSTIRHDTVPPVLLAGDKYGDYFINTVTGQMYEVNLLGTAWDLVTGGVTRSIWRSTILDGISIHRSSTPMLPDPMPSSANTIVYKGIAGLREVIEVGFDSIGYAMINAYGTIRKELPNDDYNYARFDISVKGARADVEQDVGIAPNGPPPHREFDHASWKISYFTQLTPGSNIIEVVGGQRFSRDTNGAIILADGPGTENQAHMDIYLFFRRID